MTDLKKITAKIAAYIIIPVIYAAIGFLIARILANPFIEPAKSIMRIFGGSSVSSQNAEIRSLYEDKKERPVITYPETSVETGDVETDDPPVPQEPTVNGYEIESPAIGVKIGVFEIEKIGLKVDFFYGDGTQELKNGVGQYTGSYMPGFGGPILVAGHNNTYFHSIGLLEPGDIIKIYTYYGDYEYRVTDYFIANNKSEYSQGYSLKMDPEKPEILTLYTCYPFYQFGLTPQRYFVHAEKISGPRIVFEKR